MPMDIRSYFTTLSKTTGTTPKPATPVAGKSSKSSKKRVKDLNSSIEDIIPDTPEVDNKKIKKVKKNAEPEVKRRKIVILSDSESDQEASSKKKDDKKKKSNGKVPNKKPEKIEVISDTESENEMEKTKKYVPKLKEVKPSNNLNTINIFKKKEVEAKLKKLVNPFEAFGDEPIHQKKIEKPKVTEQDIHEDEAFKKTLENLDKTVKTHSKTVLEKKSSHGSKTEKNDFQPPIGTEFNIHDDEDFEKTLLELDESELKDTGKKKSPVKTTPEKKKTPVKTNIKESTKTERNRSKSPPKVHKTPKRSVDSESSTPSTTPSRKRKLSNSEDSGVDKDQERYEKKRYSAMLYQKYLNRSGPAHLHTKWIPKGKSDCLKDLSFLITGVLDSLTREETEELIMSHGGRCTKSLSKKIKYIVVGEDAGPSKLEKARDLGTTILSEDELIDLICKKSNIENENKKKKTEETVVEEKPSKINLGKLKKDIQELQDDDEIPAVTIKGEKMAKMYDKPKPKLEKSNADSKPKLPPPPPKEIPQDQLAWVDKYKPTDMKGIIGQQTDNSNAKKLHKWLRNWYKNHDGKTKLVKPSPWAKNDDGAYFKAALLSGPPGVGKTTTATIVSKELGFDTVEFNASNTRSKKMLGEEISTLLKSKSLSGYFKDGSAPTNKHVLLMDEVDGMSGNEDRGGMQELINLLKNSHIPIICMCNDRQHPKIRSLANYCFDLRFAKPRLEQIKGAMMSVCFKEDIKISPDALTDVIMGAGMDIRQTLNNLSMWSAKGGEVSKQTAEKESAIATKDVKLGPWEVIRKVFSEEDHKTMSIDDKYGLFFYDYSINPLFVQENYLQVKPHCPNEQSLKRAAAAADSISLGDLVDAKIRGSQSWGLLDTQALFSSVIPGHCLEGHMAGQINFPSWLGKNSKTNKFKRMVSELQTHMRTTISGDRRAVNLDYLYHIYRSLITPLVKEGMDGIPKAMAIMQEYHLMREDLTNIAEMVHWPKSKDLFKNVDPKVKAAFTRAYNKDIVLPYAVTAAPVKKRRAGGGGDEEDIYGEEEDEGDEEEEENDNIENNPMIKVKKPTKGESAKGKDVKGKEPKNKAAGKPKGRRGK